MVLNTVRASRFTGPSVYWRELEARLKFVQHVEIVRCNFSVKYFPFKFDSFTIKLKPTNGSRNSVSDAEMQDLERSGKIWNASGRYLKPQCPTSFRRTRASSTRARSDHRSRRGWDVRDFQSSQRGDFGWRCASGDAFTRTQPRAGVAGQAEVPALIPFQQRAGQCRAQ